MQLQGQTLGPTLGPPTPVTEALFRAYQLHPSAFDELFGGPNQAHPHCDLLVDCLSGLRLDEFVQRRASADLVFINQGITFSVYADRRGAEKIFPFDLIPRPVPSKEWVTLEA